MIHILVHVRQRVGTEVLTIGTHEGIHQISVATFVQRSRGVSHFVRKERAPKGRIVVAAKGNFVDPVAPESIAERGSVRTAHRSTVVGETVKQMGDVAGHVRSIIFPVLLEEFHTVIGIVPFADAPSLLKHVPIGIRGFIAVAFQMGDHKFGTESGPFEFETGFRHRQGDHLIGGLFATIKLTKAGFVGNGDFNGFKGRTGGIVVVLLEGSLGRLFQKGRQFRVGL